MEPQPNPPEGHRTSRPTDSREPASLSRPRRGWITGVLFGLLAAGLASCASPQYRDTAIAMTTEGAVDLERYMGRWYEIARFPNRFEEGCVGVTADYSLNEDGSVKVVNTCREGALDGPIDVAEGRGAPDGPDGDRLQVGFVSWLPFASGDYWILDLDDGYQVAVIGNPGGTTGWVLARTPVLSAGRLEEAYAVLRRNGYDTSRMTLTPQATE